MRGFVCTTSVSDDGDDDVGHVGVWSIQITHCQLCVT